MKKRMTGMFLASFAVLLLFSPFSFAAEKKPAELRKGDKCQVCGMYIIGRDGTPFYVKWAAELLFKDGSHAVFDGPKDMFRYYFNLPKYNPSKTKADVLGAFVTEYYSTKMVDAENVIFVLGSDVTGPMGAELVPIGSAEKAKAFMKDHKGKKTLKFGEVTKEDVK